MKNVQKGIFSVLVIWALMVSSAMAESKPVADELGAMAKALQHDVDELHQLDLAIAKSPESSLEALTYRRDDRSFRLLLQLDEMTRKVADMPENDKQRIEALAKIQPVLQAAGGGVQARIVSLGDRVVALAGESNGLSGMALIEADAYLQNLEALRFKYYDALVRVIETRETLELANGSLREDLLPGLKLHAETLVGRVELDGGALTEVQARLKSDVSNTDVASTLAEITRRHVTNLSRLSQLIELLERLGEDSSSYQAILLEQGEGVSIRTLEASVVVSMIEDSWLYLKSMLIEEAPDFIFKLLIFLGMILISRGLAGLSKRGVRAALERSGGEMSVLLKDVLVSVIGGTVMVLGTLVALSQIGISLGPMLTGLGVAGFVIGFALQDTLGNFAAGGMILIYRPYDVDDFVEVVGASGLVKKMNLVSTTITTFDNQTLVIPNSKIWGDVIKNVTAQKVRRVDLVFGIGYGDDVEQAERVLSQILDEHDMVLSKPEYMVKLHELADSSVNFVVRPWVRTEDYWTVYWDLTREVKMRFDREGISIPFPQQDVHLYPQPEPQPEKEQQS